MGGPFAMDLRADGRDAALIMPMLLPEVCPGKAKPGPGLM